MMNAASAKESIQYDDPSVRNPNAALNKYDTRMAPEMIIGTVLVVVLCLFAFGLWIFLDKGLRIRLRRWMTCGWRRKEAGGGQTAPYSPGGLSDMSRTGTAVEEDLESAMRMPLPHAHVSRLPSPLRQNMTETKNSQPGQPVPILLTRS